MKLSGWSTPGKVAALATAAVVAAGFVLAGGSMFSPGELNAVRRPGVERGGVGSHAELGGACSACHPPPWSSARMADRCLACHVEVRREIDARRSLHGAFSAPMSCLQCHGEHGGPHAALTDLSRFDHDAAAFKLTGKHSSATCASCHKNGVHKGTPSNCVA